MCKGDVDWTYESLPNISAIYYILNRSQEDKVSVLQTDGRWMEGQSEL